jgi:hypothetical protein
MRNTGFHASSSAAATANVINQRSPGAQVKGEKTVDSDNFSQCDLLHAYICFHSILKKSPFLTRKSSGAEILVEAASSRSQIEINFNCRSIILLGSVARSQSLKMAPTFMRNKTESADRKFTVADL